MDVGLATMLTVGAERCALCRLMPGQTVVCIVLPGGAYWIVTVKLAEVVMAVLLLSVAVTVTV